MSHFPSANASAGSAAQLDSLTEGGKPPTARLKDAAAAHELYKRLREADRESAWQRNLVQKMYDGEAPYDKEQLRSLGQGHRFNLNFGEAAAQKESAVAAYNDITDSVECMIRVKLPETISPEVRGEKQQIIAEEYHRMVKNSPDFDTNLQTLVDIFIGHGVAFAYHSGDVDWQFKVTGFGDFLIPRQTRATEGDIQVAFATRKYGVNELYFYVQSPEKCAALGWNRDAVIKAILRATYGSKALDNVADNWEKFQARVKNNDLLMGEALADTVTVNHIWVQEFPSPTEEGTVSHYLADESGLSTDFFYKAKRRMKSMQDCFIGFTFGVGNGTYHGIRGQGYKIYPQVQASNRLRCAVLDSTFLSLSLLVEPEDADDLVTMSLVNFGPVTAMPPGLKITQQQFQSRAAEALQITQDLSIQMENHTGSYKPTPVDSAVMGRDRVTRAEVMTRAESRGALSTSAMTLFYQPWRRLHRGMFRRVQNKDYSPNQPGYEAVKEMWDRCRARGVTMAEIRAVTDVEVVRAVGAGSSSLRRMMLDELMNFHGSLDAVGQNNLLRDKFAQNVGYDMVDRYLPKVNQPRPVLDEQLAELENADLRMGHAVKVMVSQVAAIHATSHITALQETLQTLQAEQIDLARAFTHFQAAIPHTHEHLAVLEQDALQKGVFARLAQALNELENLGKQMANNLEEMQTEQIKAQGEEQAALAESAGLPGTGEPGAGGGVDGATQARIDAIRATAQAKLEAMQATHQMALQQTSEMAQQKLAIADMEASRKMYRTPLAAPTK